MNSHNVIQVEILKNLDDAKYYIETKVNSHFLIVLN
jgi:hypothetical protein